MRYNAYVSRRRPSPPSLLQWLKEAERGDPVRIGGPPSLFTTPVRTTVVIARQAFLKGSECPITTSRPLKFRLWTGEAPPKALLVRCAAKVSAAPFLDFTMT